MCIRDRYLVDHICRQQGIPVHGISPTGIERLRRHDWPGNVRELSNVLERALLMSDGDILEAADLDPVMPPPSVAPLPTGGMGGIAEAVAQAEREAILAALRNSLGNKAQAARLLGISRAALYEKIAVLGVDASAA